jgi:hypothetical protein
MLSALEPCAREQSTRPRGFFRGSKMYVEIPSHDVLDGGSPILSLRLARVSARINGSDPTRARHAARMILYFATAPDYPRVFYTSSPRLAAVRFHCASISHSACLSVKESLHSVDGGRCDAPGFYAVDRSHAPQLCSTGGRCIYLHQRAFLMKCAYLMWP